MNNKSVSDQWRAVLISDDSYQHSCPDINNFRKISKFPRIWKRILRYIKLTRIGENRKVFEVGFGGCKHLVTFAINNWEASGIECSEDVIIRANRYIDDISKYKADVRKSINLNFGDFLAYEVDSCYHKYDLVYHVGVIEHILDYRERICFLSKMFKITKSGGFVVSIVPNGTHPLRSMVQYCHLGGYCVPEINYTPESIENEMITCGAGEVIVLPHNLFNYLLYNDYYKSSQLLRKLIYYIVQCIPIDIIPKSIAQKHAEVLIGIAMKT